MIKTLQKQMWNVLKDKVVKAYTFSKDSTLPRGHSLTHIKGIYFFVPEGKALEPGNIIYIGETYSQTGSIQGRVKNHQKSLRDPIWKTELTGNKFIKRGQSVDQQLDLYYLDALKIGIDNKKTLACHRITSYRLSQTRGI